MKRDKIKRRPLADTVLENLEPEGKEYRELDGNGLYFRVKPNGRKSWSLRYKRPNGKWAWKGVGPFPQVSGKAAREEAARLLRMASDGIDLAEHEKKQDEKPALPFREAAEYYYGRRRASGIAPKTVRAMRDALDKDILPHIGDKPLIEVSRTDCMEVLARVEKRGAWETAKKIRGWLNNIFSLAIAREQCELNPASELRHVAQKRPETKHHPYLTESELPDFLKALDKSRSLYTVRVAVKMLLLTASRPGVIRQAEWSEIDLNNRVWSVPAEKMKKDRAHLYPIPDQLASELETLARITGAGQYLFPGARDNPFISTGSINSALIAIGYKRRLVGHGARHTASTLLNEHGWRSAYVDMQLSHKQPGVRGVYNKALYLAQRKIMMQWYADYLDALKSGEAKARAAEFRQRVAAAESLGREPTR